MPSEFQTAFLLVLIFYFEHGLIIGEFALGVIECLDVGGFAGFAAFLLPVLDLSVNP